MISWVFKDTFAPICIRLCAMMAMLAHPILHLPHGYSWANIASCACEYTSVCGMSYLQLLLTGISELLLFCGWVFGPQNSLLVQRYRLKPYSTLSSGYPSWLFGFISAIALCHRTYSSLISMCCASIRESKRSFGYPIRDCWKRAAIPLSWHPRWYHRWIN